MNFTLGDISAYYAIQRKYFLIVTTSLYYKTF